MASSDKALNDSKDEENQLLDDSISLDMSIHPSMDLQSQIGGFSLADEALNREFDRLFNEPIVLPSFVSFTEPNITENNVRKQSGFIPVPVINDTVPLPEVAECEYDRSFHKSHSEESVSPSHKSLYIEASILNDVGYQPNEIKRKKSIDSKANVTMESVFETESLVHQLQDHVQSLKHEKEAALNQIKTQSVVSEPQTNTSSESLDVLRLKNTITALESKITVLERKLEYSQFVTKIAEEERLKAVKKIHELEALLLEERLKQQKEYLNRGKATEHSDYLHSKKVVINDVDEDNRDIALEWRDPERKNELKNELKKKLLQQHKNTRGRTTARNSTLSDGIFKENLPFVVGKASPSFSLPANIQKVRAMIKNRSSVRSKSRSRSRGRKKDLERNDFELAIQNLEAEYSAANRKYDLVLEKYKYIPPKIEYQHERDEMSQSLRLIIREMEQKMAEISRLKHERDKLVSMSKSPNKAFASLCALKGAQKIQERLTEEENNAFAAVFGGR